jgi:hypothetical protein
MIVFGCHALYFWPMNHEENKDRERDLRERIASLMRSNEQARKKPIMSEERQKLRSAANRLDQMLQSSADADRQVLKGAAVRLDQLLADIRKGKDISAKVKRRRDGKNRRMKSHQTLSLNKTLNAS